MSLSAEAEKRKQRLLALKKRKRGQIEDLEDSQDSPSTPNDPVSPPSIDSSKPYLTSTPLTSSLPLSGRNYDPTTRTSKLGFTESPLSKLPEDFETVEEVALN